MLNRVATIARGGPTRPNLDLALTLAGVSTDAYHAPKDGLYPHICDGKDNEVETTYLDEEFLASQFKYVLKVDLWKAVNCKPAGDSIYVALSIGDSHVNSEPVSAALEPSWNQTLYLLVKDTSDLLEVQLQDWNLMAFVRKRGGLNDADLRLSDVELMQKLKLDNSELLHQMQRRNELMKRVQHRRHSSTRIPSMPQLPQEGQQPAGGWGGRVLPVDAQGQHNGLQPIAEPKRTGGAISLFRALSMRKPAAMGQLDTVAEEDESADDYGGAFEGLENEPGAGQECSEASAQLDAVGVERELHMHMEKGVMQGAEVHLTTTLLPITREVVKQLRLPRMTSKSGVNYAQIRKMKRAAGNGGGASSAAAPESSSAPAAVPGGTSTSTAAAGDEVLILDAEQPPVPASGSSSAAGPGDAAAGCSKTAEAIQAAVISGAAASSAAPENDEDEPDEANASEQEQDAQQPDEEEPPGCLGMCGPAAKVDPRHTSMSIKHLYVPILYLVNVRTDTYAWLYRSALTREIIVSFRGTASLENAATDLKFFQAHYDKAAESTYLVVNGWRRVFGSKSVTMCHRGFLAAFRSVQKKLFAVLDELTKDYKDNGKWRVLITGHSLGGGLATLCAYELAARRHELNQRMRISIYTYGAPRVGNARFAESYKKYVLDTWRFVTPKDLVPKIPRGLAYKHVNNCIWIHKSGMLQNEVLDGREAVLAQVNKLQRAGVKHHLGKYYIRALRAVIDYRNRHFYSASFRQSMRRAASTIAR